MGYTEKEIGHMTLKKFNSLSESYKKLYNFKIENRKFETSHRSNEEWIKD